MKFLNSISLCLILFFMASMSFAQSTRSQLRSSSGKSGGGLFDFAIYYGQSEGSSEPNNTYQSKSNESYYDMKLGYVFSYGLYIGAEYSTRNSGFVNGSTTGNAAAAGLGYFFTNGLQIRAFSRFNESFNDFRKGSGYQVDLGYAESFATNFFLGLMLSHRSTTFTSRDSDPLLTDYTFNSTYPMLTIGFLVN